VIKKTQPLVCIVIVNWNGGKKVWRCVSSLIKKTRYKNYKTILVDNGSTDGSIEKIEKKFREIIILRTGKNLGFTKGTNHGWDYCFRNYNPNYICDMNNDIITIQSDWLNLMVQTLEENKSAGICANKLIDYKGRLQSLFFSDKFPEREKWFHEENSADRGQYDFVEQVKAVPGGNMLIKQKVINKLGALDENFFYGPDDVDYCLRAGKLGFKIMYNGFSKSIHFGSFSYTSNAKKDFIFREQIYGQMLFNFRHGSFKDKISSPIRQLIRAIITRKDISTKHGFNNLYIHRRALFRILIFPRQFIMALYNYNHIKNDYFKK
jgi:GT2 family glycosyltransferase